MSSDCECIKGSKPSLAACPACKGVGQPVGRVTLESLLKPEAKTRLGSGAYFFCDSPECETVYFDGHGSVFVKSELTVRVGIKETGSPRPVCYCFDHSIEEIEEQVRCTGTSTVLDDIMDRMKTACWCETMSPQGKCCAGMVRGCIELAIKKHIKETGSGPGVLEPEEGDPAGPCC